MSKFFCPRLSKVKLVMYFSTREMDYKQKPETQYSLLNMNKKTNYEIVRAMERSFLQKKHKGLIKTAIFYDNLTGIELKKIVF